MTNRSGVFGPREKMWLEKLEKRADKFWPSSPQKIFREAAITRKEGVASKDVFTDSEAKAMFSKLGREIEERLFHESSRTARGARTPHEAAIRLAG
jgi:hypothetical protein